MNKLPLTLSVMTAENMVCRMLERGTELPASKTRIFTTTKIIPSAVMVQLVLGERQFARENRKLLTLRLSGINKTIGDVARIAVKVDVDQEGNIKLEAFDYGSHHKKVKKLSAEWIPDPEEVEVSIRAAEDNAEEETVMIQKCRVITRGKTLVDEISTITKEDRVAYSEEEWEEIKETAKVLKKRVTKVQPADLTPLDEKVINELILKLTSIIKR